MSEGMMIYLIMGLFGIAACALVAAAVQILATAVAQYRTTVTTRARVNLAELYIFIEPEKLFALNAISLVLATLVTVLVTGSLIITMAVSALAAVSPFIVYRYLRRRRIKRVMEQLPDTLTSLSASLKAGASLMQALEVTVEEESPPIAQELHLLLKELRVGVTFEVAMDNLAARIRRQDLDLVVSGMKISREIGGNLGDVLERLASTVRRKQEMEGKIDALTAQGRMQGYVMTGLPFLVAGALWHIEGESMRRLVTDPAGWLTLVVLAVLIAAGYFFIRKIVNIDV